MRRTRGPSPRDALKAWTLGDTELGELHKDLSRGVRKVLVQDVKFAPYSADKPGLVFYACFPRTKDVLQVTLADDLGHARPAFLLCEPASGGPPFWASWRDVWRPLRGGYFGFVTGGWALFQGHLAATPWQVLRAEWDRANPEREPESGDWPSGSPLAPRPHWHVEARLTAGEPQPEYVGDVGSAGPGAPLGEVQIEDLGGVDETAPVSPCISGVASVLSPEVHLGMAGWRHSGDDINRWQWQGGGLFAELAVWAAATLSLVKREFERLG